MATQVTATPGVDVPITFTASFRRSLAADSMVSNEDSREWFHAVMDQSMTTHTPDDETTVARA
jgi:hypothetical protein